MSEYVINADGVIYDGDVKKFVFKGKEYVPVIRCKDCKHYDKGTIFPCGIASDFDPGDDDYCSSAEGKE